MERASLVLSEDGDWEAMGMVRVFFEGQSMGTVLWKPVVECARSFKLSREGDGTDLSSDLMGTLVHYPRG